MTASTEERLWPQPLQAVEGPYPELKLRGVLAGMGTHAPSAVSLMEEGLLSPDMMTQFTLYLLARQPRKKREREGTKGQGTKKKGAPGVAGRIWAREQVTYHRPVKQDEAFVIEGESTGRYVKKHRRYATTGSRTRDAEGRRVASNITTGLLSYRPDPSLADAVEGIPLEEMDKLGPDHEAAKNNPHLDRLAEVELGETLGGSPMIMSLEMMAARDTDNPDNPIHSDPALAKAAGLAKPIAGGSHVQAFALEVLMARFGPEVLLHGAHVDTRWKAPTESDVSITPSAVITAVSPELITAEIEVRLTEGPVAIVGRVHIPRPR